MAQDTITVRMDVGKQAATDALARATDRGRDHLINDAVGAYLAVHQRQIAYIEEASRQPDAGEFATDEKVAAAFARWR